MRKHIIVLLFLIGVFFGVTIHSKTVEARSMFIVSYTNKNKTLKSYSDYNYNFFTTNVFWKEAKKKQRIKDNKYIKQLVPFGYKIDRVIFWGVGSGGYSNPEGGRDITNEKRILFVDRYVEIKCKPIKKKVKIDLTVDGKVVKTLVKKTVKGSPKIYIDKIAKKYGYYSERQYVKPTKSYYKIRGLKIKKEYQLKTLFQGNSYLPELKATVTKVETFVSTCGTNKSTGLESKSGIRYLNNLLWAGKFPYTRITVKAEKNKAPLRFAGTASAVYGVYDAFLYCNFKYSIEGFKRLSSTTYQCVFLEAQPHTDLPGIPLMKSTHSRYINVKYLKDNREYIRLDLRNGNFVRGTVNEQDYLNGVYFSQSWGGCME